MTTDDKTPDPTPAILSAARLAEIRKLAAPQKPMSSEQMSTYRGRVIRSLRALLAHIDALAAGEVPDGEALGRGLYERMGATQVAFEEIRLIQRRVPPWEPLSAENREMYIREALILYQQGFAAGAVAISGEGDDPATAGAILILMERRDREQREAHAAGRAEGETERARLVEDVRKWGKLYQERDATIASLTGERDALAKRLDLGPAEVVTLAAWSDEKAKVAKVGAELAEARASVVHADFAGGLSVCSRPGETTKDVARITCPACLVRLYSVANEDADKMRQEVERLLAERDTDLLDATEKERTACAAFLRSEGLEGAAAEMVGVRARAARRARGEGQGS